VSDTSLPPPPPSLPPRPSRTVEIGRDRGESPNAKTDLKLPVQGEELARLETYAFDIDLPGWAAEEWGAEPVSTRSFVTRQRDHRRDRGKPVLDAVVNYTSLVGDRTRRGDVHQNVTPSVSSPVSKIG
jgi:hypothetical protein